MTEVENQTLNLLKILIENREEIYERLAPRLNIVDILGYKERETSNSKLLYYLFNTHFKYYDKEINFAKDFALYFVNKNYKNEIKEAKFENVYREFQTKEGRKIDILIVFDKFEIIIENKINANALENQLGDYYIDRNNGKLVFLIYLTRGGYEASEYSIGKVNIEKDKIYYLSHDDIAEWIENDILNKYEFLKFDKKYQSICSALIQIRDNEKIITNPNRENNMEKEEIKKFFEENNYFETLLKDVNDVDKKVIELNTFYELLENAQKVILDKMDGLAEKFYEKIKEEPQEYEKIKSIAYMYNKLIIIRVNSLVERFEGGNWYNYCFYRFFSSKERGIDYLIDIYVNNYQYSLQLYSKEQMLDKYEQDNKYIEAWLEKHNLFEGFYKKGNDTAYRWTKDFKFPEEEKKLYEFTEKLIKLLKEDVESIYSGK